MINPIELEMILGTAVSVIVVAILAIAVWNL